MAQPQKKGQWSESEISVLKGMYVDRRSDEEIATAVGRKVDSVQRKIKDLGLSSMSLNPVGSTPTAQARKIQPHKAVPVAATPMVFPDPLVSSSFSVSMSREPTKPNPDVVLFLLKHVKSTLTEYINKGGDYVQIRTEIFALNSIFSQYEQKHTRTTI